MGRIRVLVNTSIVIDYLRVKIKEQTPYALATEKEITPVISLVTYAELFSGKSVWEKSEARQNLEQLLVGLQIVTVDQAVAQEAGRIKALYNIALFDAFIAATALDQHIPLFTLNKSHFEKIKSLTFYTISRKN